MTNATLRLVLASKSPRRRELLAEHGFAHELVSAGVDDSDLPRGGTEAEPWVISLAYLKARAGLRALADGGAGALVLGADTVVSKDGRVIGQPTDADDARGIIERLAGGEHRVLTGVALLTTDRRHLLLDVAHVRFGALSTAQIDGYISSGDWAGKAGAYNFAERVAQGWPLTCQGDPTGVMGLPMRRLTPILESVLHDPDSGATLHKSWQQMGLQSVSG
ncbi:MAG: Maf family protein [Planctomycetota bacterium]